MKRGRPKGATAYPETAVCIKCGVFRPKRRGYCDRCRPRNRGAASKIAANSSMPATCPLRPSSNVATTSSAGVAVSRERDALVSKTQPAMGGQSANVDLNATGWSATSSSPPTNVSSSATRGIKRQRAAVEVSTPPQIREKRRRTVSAPATGVVAGRMGHHALPSLGERNRNVDVVSVLAHASGQGKDRKLDPDNFFHFGPSSSSAASHQLALLLPRSDGTAVDVVPIQFLSSPTTASPSAALSHTPSSSSLSPGHPLMSLANASVLAASRSSPPLSLTTASPSRSWSSPASSPPHIPLSTPSPFSSPGSSFACPGNAASSSCSFSFALPPTAEPRPTQSQGSSTSASSTNKAGDLILPSLCSLQLPRPALPTHLFTTQTSSLHLASLLAPATSSLRLAPN